MLAEMTTLICAMESVVYRTAAKYDKGENVTHRAAIVKLFCSESLYKIVDYAVQILGVWDILENILSKKCTETFELTEYLKVPTKFKKELLQEI